MNKMHRAGLALVLAACAMPALAQESEQEMRPYVSGGYTNNYQDNDRNSDNGNGWFVGVGKAITQYWGWGLSGSWAQFDRDSVANPKNRPQDGARKGSALGKSVNVRYDPVGRRI